MKHCTKNKYLEHLNTRKEYTALPASWLEQNPDPTDFCRPSKSPYGVAWSIKEDATCPTIYA